MQYTGGYSGLKHALHMRRTEVIAALAESGLRGRGGAGFPAAVKWQACAAAEAETAAAGAGGAYVVCNAVDADPRSRVATTLLSEHTHSVLEGLLIAAYAVGASQGFVCVNETYGPQIAAVEEALEQLRRAGLLGEDILGSGIGCDLALVPITPALVAGEETALIRVLERRQAIPYLCPPYPATRGLAGRPTLVHAAETLAKVAEIFRVPPADDAAPRAQAPGAQPDPGTKFLTVWWQEESRVVEVPLGTTLRAVVLEVAGVDPESGQVKAVRFGGPTGSFFAGATLDTPIGYDELQRAGSHMGSGTLEVIPAETCGVELARDALRYLSEESCGACGACREGTRQLADMLDDIATFRGSPDVDLMLELAGAMKEGSICGLGRRASAPFLSSLELFAADFQAHLTDKLCPGDQGHV